MTASPDYQTKFLKYVEIEDTGKTKVWRVSNVDGTARLGTVRWYAQWRRYVLAPYPNTVFDAECLTDIQEFIAQQMKARKIARGGTVG